MTSAVRERGVCLFRTFYGQEGLVLQMRTSVVFVEKKNFRDLSKIMVRSHVTGVDGGIVEILCGRFLWTGSLLFIVPALEKLF